MTAQSTQDDHGSAADSVPKRNAWAGAMLVIGAVGWVGFKLLVFLWHSHLFVRLAHAAYTLCRHQGYCS